MDTKNREKSIFTVNEQFQKYLNTLANTGIFLMIATVIALIWANSPFAHYYEELWHHTYFEIGFSNFNLDKHLIHWINDGLMAIFFFVVGLEIKRELVAGELNTVKKASLPFFAALGGMIVPIIIYLSFGLTGESSRGWGIPMATDIAFSIGVLAMLGSRVPISVKVFLTALAIVDDLGAVMVIAFFYTSSINWTYLIIALVLVAILFAYNKLQGYNLWTYTGFGLAIWVLFLGSGVHATIAGVLVAFTIPVYPKVRLKEFIPRIENSFQKYSDDLNKGNETVLNHTQFDAIAQVNSLSRKVQSPLQHIEHDLSRWVNYLILPIFALANAGVVLYDESAVAVDDSITMLGYSIATSLVLGKVIGIFLFTWLAVKLKLAAKPDNVSWTSFIGLGFLGGIGFTMSMFIATLAFDSSQVLNSAKIGIFAGSVLAGVVGYVILKISLKKTN